jgi:signal transduction histidine kinase/streptogramin lyase
MPPGPRRRAALVVVLSAAVAPAAHALDPGRATSQYVVSRWNASDLPGPAVHALLQGPDGYLWLGTSAGLVRFDGARFVTYDARNTKGFADGGIARLTPGRDGAFYLGTTTGAILEYRDGVFSAIPVGGDVEVRALFAARDGSLWIATPGQPLRRWKDGRAESLAREMGAEVPGAIVEDAQGALWFGTWREGLIRFVDGAFLRRRVPRDTVQALTVDRDGVFWIGTPHGVYRLEGDVLQHLTERDGLPHENISAILHDRDGNVWIGTRGGGVVRYRDGRFSSLTTREGLSDDDVRCLLEDGQGNVWAGTAGGLSAISDGRFVTYGALEGLHEAGIPSVAGSADGSVWVGTTSAGVARLRNGVVTHVPLPRDVGKDAVLVLYEDRTRGLWISVENGRLFCVRNGVTTEHTPVGVPAHWKISAISEDDEGPLFFVSGFGHVVRLRQRRLVPLYAESPRLGYAHFIHRGTDGGLWLGTPRGLVRVGEREHQAFTMAEGLPRDRVRWLSEDEDGAFWLATAGGLAHLKDGVVQKLTVEGGLPENYLRVVLDDRLGHLWIASTGRFFRLDKRAVLDVFAGRAKAVTPLLFDTSDGLRTTETLFGNSPGFRGADGRLWFATARGVSVVDPARIVTDTPAPEVRIERLTVDGRGGAPGTASYPPGRGQVLVEYTALSFGAAGRVRFRYRLEGLDDDWVAAQGQRSAYYGSLPPGRYRFLVEASNRDGVWNGVPAATVFELHPPFHRTGWFYMAAAALLIGAAFAAYRARVAQVRARYAVVAAERERIAREWHDSLAQGIAAVGIQLQAMMDKLGHPEAARQHAELAWRMVQSSLEQVRGSIWALRSRNLEQGGLVAAVQETLSFLTTGTRTEGAVQVEGTPFTMHPDVEWNALRIVQEAITNAVRHAAADHVEVSLAYEPQALRLAVRDDGCGFDGEGALGGGEPHFGLLGMRERAVALGGTLEIASARGQGTTIRAELPLRLRRGNVVPMRPRDGGRGDEGARTPRRRGGGE